MLNKKQKKCLELMACGDFTQKEIASQIKVFGHIGHLKKGKVKIHF
ncbi:hypothetical protein [Alkaliphilus serpentinus]|nr:hypothetical protein [Alkaliphilus serpentinus]